MKNKCTLSLFDGEQTLIVSSEKRLTVIWSDENGNMRGWSIAPQLVYEALESFFATPEDNRCVWDVLDEIVLHDLLNTTSSDGESKIE